MALADAIAKAVAVSPMANGSVSIIPNRKLLVDGDGLAYYCAGKDGSDPADAKQAVLNKIRSAQRACGAEQVIVLLTASGSTKGGRYAVASVKPYQGQRSNSRRPDNWRFLRDFLEQYTGDEFTVHISIDQEADDLWAQYVAADPMPHENIVLYTQDKDARHTCCIHLDWVTHAQIIVPPGTWEIVRNDKVYGRKWFWLQMLHGDAADNIPGLERMVVNGKEVKVGEVTANRILAVCKSDEDARTLVTEAYASYYGEQAGERLAEQGQLLWMQRSKHAMDAFMEGGPLASLDAAHWRPIVHRINEAQAINDLANSTQDNAG